MPSMVIIGNTVGGHGAYPPTKVLTGSTDVFGESIGVCVDGSDLGLHTQSPQEPPHKIAAANGSDDVMINDKPVTRLGDATSCNGIMMEGASSIIIN